MQKELVQLIRDQIRADGPQSFAWFMEQALYHPLHGYYSSGRATIGRRGDYFTNVSVGPLFGRLIAAQFVEIWERLDRIDNFTIVEQGAHDGQFACDVLEALRESSPESFSALHYRIVEPFPIWQDRQSQKLEGFRGKVDWSATLEPFVGIHFSNELLDAMPIALRERAVGCEGEKFVFAKTTPNERPNQAQLDWVDVVAKNLQRGFVIAIDYGFARPEFRETIQARAQHRHLDSPFEEIGDADITAHINWTDISERAEQNGLQIAGFTDQHHFLTGIISAWPQLFNMGSLDWTALSSQVRGAGAKNQGQALQTLLHPEMLGRAFQVLALAKDVDLATGRVRPTGGLATPLAGFKFGRDARIALGL